MLAGSTLAPTAFAVVSSHAPRSPWFVGATVSSSGVEDLCNVVVHAGHDRPGGTGEVRSGLVDRPDVVGGLRRDAL